MNADRKQRLCLDIGLAIRSERLGAGVTQAALAEAVSMHRTTLVDMEAGRHGAGLDHLLDIAAALNVPLAHFIPGLAPDESVTSMSRRVHKLERQLDRVRKAANG